MKKKIKKTIDKAAWNCLTQEQQNLMIQLGYEKEKKKRKRKKKSTKIKLKEYTLEVHTICSICQNEAVNVFKMKRVNNPLPHLKSKNCISKFLIPNKVLEEYVIGCPQCFKNLFKMRKVDLIKMIIKYARCHGG